MSAIRSELVAGSLMMLTGQQVKAIYEGFAACDVWVIWSLKKDLESVLRRRSLPNHAETMPKCMESLVSGRSG